MRVCVVIPALNPDKQLNDYVKELLSVGVERVIIINDGSDLKCEYIFQALSLIEQCHVLQHPKNRGKGAALKTAFRYLLKEKKVYEAVITADADGQHSVKDVAKMVNYLSQNKAHFTLGVRNFNEEHVPFRSAFGNKVTNYFFRCLYKRKLQDTQTGLRGIPASLLPSFTFIAGEGYEYEMNMLIYLVKKRIPIYEIQIETLYFNHNKGSHFSPLIDSLKVFVQLCVGAFRRATSLK